jgi:hypothetical protein
MGTRIPASFNFFRVFAAIGFGIWDVGLHRLAPQRVQVYGNILPVAYGGVFQIRIGGVFGIG